MDTRMPARTVPLSRDERMRKVTLALIFLNILQIAGSYGQRVAFAYYFGTSALLDIYFICLIIPNLLVMFFHGLGTATTPTCARLEEESGEEAAKRVWGSLFWLTLAFVCLVLPIMLWQLSFLLKFSGGNLTPDQEQIAIYFSRYLLPAQFGIQGMSYFLSTLLTYKKHFVVCKLGSTMVLVILTLGIVLFGHRVGVFAAVIAFFVGSAAELALDLYFAWRYINFGALFDLLRGQFPPRLKRIAGQALPVMMLALNGQAMAAADSIMSRALGDGALSILNYTYAIFQIPQLVFTKASTTVKFPDLFRQAARNDYAAFAGNIYDTIESTMLWIFPCTVGMLVLRTPMVSVMLEHGRFSSSDTSSVASLLVFFAPISILWAMWLCLGRPLVALEKSHTVMLIEFTMTGLSIGLNFLLRPLLGLSGLVLSTAIAMTFTITGFLLVIRREIKILSISHIFSILARPFIAASVMGLVCSLLLAAMALGGMSSVAQVVVIPAIGCPLYFALAASLKIPDAIRIAGWVGSKTGGWLSPLRQTE